MRLLKVLKEKNRFLRYFNETFKLSSGIERFTLSLVAILIFCHIIACCWYLQADFHDTNEMWIYAHNLVDLSIFSVILFSKIKIFCL